MLRCRGLPLTCVMLCIHHNVGIDAGIRPGLLSAPDSQVWHTTQAQLDEERKRELQSVIQAHFKEWLLSSGNMRQVRRQILLRFSWTAISLVISSSLHASLVCHYAC